MTLTGIVAMRCAREGDEEGLREVLRKEEEDTPSWINEKCQNDLRGSTALHLASECGHLGVVKCLLQSGALINGPDNFKSTPLHLASNNGHLEVMKHLISSGADLNCPDNSGKPALHRAIMFNRVDVVNILLSAGAVLPTDQELDSAISRNDEIADAITKHLKWQRRKSFMMFLVNLKYLSMSDGQNMTMEELLKTRPLSNAIHRVFMTEDLQRSIVSFI